MFATLKRIFSAGFVNFWRNGWLSTATVLIMTITLLVWTGLLLLNVVMTGVLDSLASKIDIGVYFNLDAPESAIKDLQQKIQQLPQVADTKYISRDEAIGVFKDKHSGDSTLVASLQELGSNPFEASLNIRAKETGQYESIADFLDQFSVQGGSASGEKNIISKINFAENKTAIERLSHIISVTRQSGLVLSLIMAFIAILVAFNTVRLAIYSSREEITVMKLVGASNWFVRGPFIVEGTLHGVFSSFFALGVMIPALGVIGPRLASFLPEINLISYFYGNVWQIVLLQTAAGITLGVFSSLIAIRRYLKI